MSFSQKDSWIVSVLFKCKAEQNLALFLQYSIHTIWLLKGTFRDSVIYNMISKYYVHYGKVKIVVVEASSADQ